ncbi:MAG: CDP-alcohol phosphatidyltransferase family protein [Candidatus Kapabacteria bacterium]|jgi:CDP-diacylglycerol--glycerol-3-phosphate 3-phosphatidyltransferase|nr:CDP-alcohol phosphatidyltransferase family protein [Candidatus Kapabacteria bacterium]
MNHNNAVGLWTWSNAISAIRLVMTFPIVWSLLQHESQLSVVLCLLAAGTDWLDGYVARRTATVSEWGKVIDPLADKVLVGSVVAVLLVLNKLPLWFVATVLGRDGIILLGSVVARRYTPVVLPSLWSGKIAVSSIAITGILAMLTSGWIVNAFMVVSCATMLVSLYDYAVRLLSLRHGQR